MKARNMTAEDRQDRRDAILWGREEMRALHKERGTAFIKSKTMRKVFSKTRFGKLNVTHDYGAYPHSSARQQARYARQTAAGQIKLARV